MTTPSVTLRSIQNDDTGIDISIPRFQEEEAPLGGISILFEISVLTRLETFKTRLHTSEDVVHFSIYKAYREIEELFNKLNKKYAASGLPFVPKASATDKLSTNEKVKVLDKFMNAVAKNHDMCNSPIFTQFIGINSQKTSHLSSPQIEASDSCDKNLKQNGLIAAKDTTTNDDDAEVFPKMKNVAAEKSVSPINKNADLFEEDKHTKKTISIEINKKKSSQGLFDDFDDDCLFNTKPTEKAVIPPKREEKIKQPTADIKKPEVQKKHKNKLLDEKIDDSDIIIKDRKLGEVSLFSEQDLGEYITKDEELLFLVTSPSKGKINTLLSLQNELLCAEAKDSVDANLDDLLKFEPLPSSPPNTREDVTVQQAEAPRDPPKPVPLPRKKSLGKVDTESLQKPEVMPRKVFLNKTEAPTKPLVAAKPKVPTKPSKPPPPTQAKPPPPPKPKPPPKKTPTVHATSEHKTNSADSNKRDETKNVKDVTDAKRDLGELDILKYIEQEEKSLDSELGLFD